MAGDEASQAHMKALGSFVFLLFFSSSEVAWSDLCFRSINIILMASMEKTSFYIEK